MVASYAAYLNLIANRSGYRANWEPNRPLEIGMIGLITNGVFDVQTSLQQQGLQPGIFKDMSAGQLDYTSTKNTSIQTKINGDISLAETIISRLDSGFIIELKSASAVVFKAEKTFTHQIDNMAEMEEAILEKFRAGSWKKEWVIITQLQQAGAATIIISNSGNSKIELKANARVNAGEFKLTNAALGLSVVSETGSNFKILAQNGITPLYRVMGIRHPLFAKPGLKVMGDDNSDKYESLTVQNFDSREIE